MKEQVDNYTKISGSKLRGALPSTESSTGYSAAPSSCTRFLVKTPAAAGAPAQRGDIEGGGGSCTGCCGRGAKHAVPTEAGVNDASRTENMHCACGDHVEIPHEHIEFLIPNPWSNRHQSGTARGQALQLTFLL